MRTNRELLKQWIRDQKKINPSIESEVLAYLRISISTYKKILYLQGYCPNPQIRFLLAQKTKIEESKLFPMTGIEKEAA